MVDRVLRLAERGRRGRRRSPGTRSRTTSTTSRPGSRDNRNVPHPSVFFRVFNGIATFLDNLVGWLTSFFFKLTWVGTTALGVLVVLRFGGRRAALGVARRVRLVRG